MYMLMSVCIFTYYNVAEFKQNWINMDKTFVTSYILGNFITLFIVKNPDRQRVMQLELEY